MTEAFVEDDIFRTLMGNDDFTTSGYADRDLAWVGTPNQNSENSYLDPSQELTGILEGFNKSYEKDFVNGIDWENAEQGLLNQQFNSQKLGVGSSPTLPSSGEESNLSPATSPGYAEVKFDSDVTQFSPWYSQTGIQLSDVLPKSVNTFQQSNSQAQDSSNQLALDDEDDGQPGEKSLKRKLQTRAASKLYRQRKKALELQLTERLQKLEEEKKALIQQNQLAERLLLNLQEENQRLRSKQETSAVSLPAEKQILLNKLAIQIQEGATEKVMEETLNAIKECSKKCFQVGQCSLKRLISPQTVQKLVSNGFFEKKENWEILQNRGNGLCSFQKQINSEILGLTKIQSAELEKVCETRGEELSVIYSEREELISHIVSTFQKLKTNREDSASFLETVTCLEHLRQSLSSEANIWNQGYYQMLAVLNTLQKAQALLKTKVQYSSVCQLVTFWNALSDHNPTNGDQCKANK